MLSPHYPLDLSLKVMNREQRVKPQPHLLLASERGRGERRCDLMQLLYKKKIGIRVFFVCMQGKL